MQQSLSFLMIFSIFLFAALFSQISGQSRPAGCAPMSDVQDALRTAQQLAAIELGPKDAAELLAILRERAFTAAGMVCFLSGDFSEFGHILAKLFTNHQERSVMETSARIKDEEWQPTFNKNEMKDSGAKGCACTTCTTGYASWCSPTSSVGECCPDICANIFRAISVGALIGLKRSGVDACCEDGASPCHTDDGDSRSMSTKPSTPPSKREDATSTTLEEPNIESKDNSRTDDGLVDEKSNKSTATETSAAATTSPKPTLSPSPRLSPSPENIAPTKRSHEVVFSIAGNSGTLIFNSQGLQLGKLPEGDSSIISPEPGAATGIQGETTLEETQPADADPPSPFQTNGGNSEIPEGLSPFAALATDRRPSPTPAALLAVSDDSDSRAALERAHESPTQGIVQKESNQTTGSGKGASEAQEANPPSRPDPNLVTEVIQATGPPIVSNQPLSFDTTSETTTLLPADPNSDSASSASTGVPAGGDPFPEANQWHHNAQLASEMPASTLTISELPVASPSALITSAPSSALSNLPSNEEESDILEESTLEPSMRPLR